MTIEEMVDFCAKRRTSRAISAYITENLFERFFVDEKLDLVTSKGWYLSYNPNNGSKYIFIAKNKLNELDNEIIGKVDIPVWQIKQTDENIALESLNSGCDQSEIDEFVALNGLTEMPRPYFNHGKDEINKINNYCQYLYKNDMLDYVVNIVDIENAFLNKYFYTTNLDLFIKNKLGVMLLEIKFKYSDKKNNFGINVMQAHTLNYFNSKGIYTVNVILNNPNEYDVLDYINAEYNTYLWLYSNVNNIGGTKKTAPKETEFFNKKVQKYYSIPMCHYSQMLRTANIINCRCPVCNSSLTLRKGPYGKFLGCTQFATTGCKGKLKF